MRWNKNLFLSFVFCCLALGVAAVYVAYAGGYPHYLQNGLECANCHNVHSGLPNLIWEQAAQQNIDHTSPNQLCWSCHNDSDAQAVVTHSSLQGSNKYGNWTVECVVCHEPHFQRQAMSYSDDPMAQGVVAAVDATTLRKSGAADWVPDAYQGMIVVPNTDHLYISYRIVGNTADTLTVDPDVSTPQVDGSMDLTQVSVGDSFLISFGRLIRNQIDLGRIKEYSSTSLPLPSPSYPKNGVRAVKTVRPQGVNSFADGDATYDGICEVCHTQTKYHRNNNANGNEDHVHGPNTSNCMTCHDHTVGFVHGGGSGAGCESCHGHDAGYEYTPGEFSEGAGTFQSHSTHTENDSDDLKGPHIGCSDCHNTASYPYFKSGTDGNGDGLYSLTETDVCDTCHSPYGAFDGVFSSGNSIGAKANWPDGIYAGTDLAAGKEKWCAGCHDDIPANSRADGSGVDAPVVMGDGATYGYYTTGHGASGAVECSGCHDFTVAHIDHNHRTYEADDDTYTAVNPYTASYRLQEISGQPAMNMPRACVGPNYNPHSNWEDFALCLNCHDRFEVIGEDSRDVSDTNFWDFDSSISNAHWLHLGICSFHADTDWDGTADSAESCISCHNVHGSPTGPMIRHGELISPPGTTSWVPAFNFYYLDVGDGSATATYTPSLSGGTYNVYAWWPAYYNRSSIVKYLINHDGGQSEAIVNQEGSGGQWNLLGQYTVTTSSGSVILTSEGANENIFADAIQWERVGGGETVIVDDPAATYQESWTEVTSAPNNDLYGTSARYYFSPLRLPSASADESDGAIMNSKGYLADNHLCNACHSNFPWFRQPAADLRIVQAQASPNQMASNQSAPVLFTAQVTDTNSNVTSVVINLMPVNGGNSQTMYDNGTNGDTVAGDGIYSCQFTMPAGKTTGPKRFAVTANDADGNTARSYIEFSVVQPGALIIDDLDALYTGSWTAVSSLVGSYSIGYQFHPQGTGTSAATFSFTIATPGDYDVYGWWPNSSQWASNAPFTINYEGGSDTVRVYQKINGAHWNLLGTYFFAAGTYSVVLTDDADGSVCADAIQIAPAGFMYPFPISDNPDASYVGSWLAAPSLVDDYGDDSYYTLVGDGSETSTWTLAVPEADNYNVYVWWPEGTTKDRGIGVPYTISYEGGSTTVQVSQQIRGGRWNWLGNYPFGVGDYSVVMANEGPDHNSGQGGPWVYADAIRFEAGGPPAAPYPIADDWDAVLAGNWYAVKDIGDAYNSDYQRISVAGDPSSATWSVAVPAAGNYNVYAWWPEGTSDAWASDAPYTITYEGGTETVRVSQQIRGGQWNWLGNFPFAAGDYNVVLTNDGFDHNYGGTGPFVIADAVKFEPGSPPPAPYPIADNKDAVYGGDWYALEDVADAHETDYQRVRVTDAPSSATWTVDVPTAGNYNVYAWWPEGSSDLWASDAPFTINYEGGSETVRVSQQIRGGQWNWLGNFPFAAGNNTVVLTNDAFDHNYGGTGPFVIADAIKFEPGGPPPAPYPIADNKDAVYDGDWYALEDIGDAHETDYQRVRVTDTPSSATWTVAVPTAGTYNVYAWWPEGSSDLWASDAPFTISYEGGSETVRVSQQIRGGQWNWLGNFLFAAGDYTVILTNDAVDHNAGGTGPFVIADAVKFEPGGPPPAPYPIADNKDAVYDGNWYALEDIADAHETDYQRVKVTDTPSSATWTVAVPTAGTYNVYAWWPEGSSDLWASDAPFTISYEGGSETVEVSQQIRGGQWNWLGNFPFAAGDYTVVLTNDAVDHNAGGGGPFVIADAIKFEPGSPPPAPYPIADNKDAAYVGSWYAVESVADANDSDYQYVLIPDDPSSATWTVAVPASGNYNVYAWWPEGTSTSRASDAPYTINYDGGTDTVRVSQQIRGGQWNWLGNFPFIASDYTVVLTNDAVDHNYGGWGPSVIGDAVKFELGSSPAAPYPVADNWDAMFTGPWYALKDDPDAYGQGDYQYNTKGTGTDRATWSVEIPKPGQYSVYAWWKEGTDRATNAPYTINYDGGSDTVAVNQTTVGSTWNLLGSYGFATGKYTVVLSDAADNYVIADAVKWLPVSTQVTTHNPPAYNAISMDFTADFLDADGVSTAQVVGYSSGSGIWVYENMANGTEDTWDNVLGVNDWLEGSGYYFKVTDGSANVIYFGCGGAQYTVETDAQNDAFIFGSGACAP